jgi:hypothetical protein
MRRCLALAAALVVGCAAPPVAFPSPSRTPAETRTEPSATAAPLTFDVPKDAARTEGGCGETVVYRGTVSRALATATGDNVPPTPYAIARPPIAAGFIFGHPLHVAAPGELSTNKVLWVVGTARTGPLLVEGRPLGKSSPTIAYSFPPNAGPGEIYPSGVDVPEPGCWEFTLRWAGQVALLELLYR